VAKMGFRLQQIQILESPKKVLPPKSPILKLFRVRTPQGELSKTWLKKYPAPRKSESMAKHMKYNELHREAFAKANRMNSPLSQKVQKLVNKLDKNKQSWEKF